MTLYDRLEDARERRKAALATRDHPAPDKPDEVPEPTATPIRTPITPPDQPETLSRRRRPSGLWIVAAALVVGALYLAYGPPGTFRSSSVATDPEPVQPPEIAATPDPQTEDIPPTGIITDLRGAVLASPRITSAPQVPTPEDPYVVQWTPSPYASASPDGAFATPDLAEGPALPVPPTTLPATPPARPVIAAAQPVPEDSLPRERFDVVLHFPNRVAQDEAEALAASAARAGFVIEKLRPAPFSISQTNIRFFHAEDAEGAARLAEALGGELRDFTDFRPPPDVGILEIYMAGRGTGASGGASGGLAGELDRLQRGIQNAINAIRTGN